MPRREIVREALAEKDRLGIKMIWMQLGVISEEAARAGARMPASPSSWTAAPRSSMAAFPARSAGWASTASVIDNRKPLLFGKGGSLKRA